MLPRSQQALDTIVGWVGYSLSYSEAPAADDTAEHHLGHNETGEHRLKNRPVGRLLRDQWSSLRWPSLPVALSSSMVSMTRRTRPSTILDVNQKGQKDCRPPEVASQSEEPLALRRLQQMLSSDTAPRPEPQTQAQSAPSSHADGDELTEGSGSPSQSDVFTSMQ